jgi:ketosteroid isomerase-like protein
MKALAADMAAAVDVVTAWHDALNTGDNGRLLDLVTADVEVGGPRGAGRGVDLLREWVDRAGIHLIPARTFYRGDVVVVEQRATWQTTSNGQPTEPTTVASVFRMQGERIASILRFDDLTAALSAAGLTDSDEVEEGV